MTIELLVECEATSCPVFFEDRAFHFGNPVIGIMAIPFGRVGPESKDVSLQPFKSLSRRPY